MATNARARQPFPVLPSPSRDDARCSAGRPADRARRAHERSGDAAGPPGRLLPHRLPRAALRRPRRLPDAEGAPPPRGGRGAGSDRRLRGYAARRRLRAATWWIGSSWQTRDGELDEAARGYLGREFGRALHSRLERDKRVERRRVGRKSAWALRGSGAPDPDPGGGGEGSARHCRRCSRRRHASARRAPGSAGGTGWGDDCRWMPVEPRWKRR